jgi:hypothetical protein
VRESYFPTAWTEAAAVTVGGCFPAGTPVPTPKGLVPIEATWNHPFLVVQGAELGSRRLPMDLPAGEEVATIHGRWVEAREIREGDVLLSRSGGSSTVIGTSSRNVTGEVYFLETEEFHNHAVGREGILVHNGGKECAGPPSFVADHPFLFYIRDEPTGSILFMGRVTDPVGE